MVVHKRVRLASWSARGHQLSFDCEIGGFLFRTSHWQDGASYDDARGILGGDLFEKLVFHVIAFDMNKFTSAGVTEFDAGPLSHCVTSDFHDLWQKVWREVWGQWRFENNEPYWPTPSFINPMVPATPPGTVLPGSVASLSLCGGGKDSLVAAKLLERACEPFDTLAYSHSIYGASCPQHRLIEGLSKSLGARAQRKIWVTDDFMDSPALELMGSPRKFTSCAAETPASIFASLPLMATLGFTNAVMGHERSADGANLVWSTTGEAINHQWGKSFEAEMLLSNYIKRHLFSNVSVGSVLKPIGDPLIFWLLRRDRHLVKLTHSCNIEKPWCRRCPKCAYVWLGMMTFLNESDVLATFGDENLFNEPALAGTWRALLGMEDHTPFECVGQPNEVRLFFALCVAQKKQGRSIDEFRSLFSTLNYTESVVLATRVDQGRSALPLTVMEKVQNQMLDQAVLLRNHLNRLLGLKSTSK